MWPHYPVLARRPCVVGANRVVAIVPRVLLRLTAQRLLIWMSGPAPSMALSSNPSKGSLTMPPSHHPGRRLMATAAVKRAARPRCRSAFVLWAPALPPPCPPCGLPVEHRCGQTYGGSQEHQGVTHEMDQHEPGAHDLLPPFVARRVGSMTRYRLSGFPGVDPLSRSSLSGQVHYLVDSGLNRDDGGPG
jgi:hypothetical protein